MSIQILFQAILNSPALQHLSLRWQSVLAEYQTDRHPFDCCQISLQSTCPATIVAMLSYYWSNISVCSRGHVPGDLHLWCDHYWKHEHQQKLPIIWFILFLILLIDNHVHHCSWWTHFSFSGKIYFVENFQNNASRLGSPSIPHCYGTASARRPVDQFPDAPLSKYTQWSQWRLSSAHKGRDRKWWREWGWWTRRTWPWESPPGGPVEGQRGVRPAHKACLVWDKRRAPGGPYGTIFTIRAGLFSLGLRAWACQESSMLAALSGEKRAPRQGGPGVPGAP